MTPPARIVSEGECGVPLGNGRQAWSAADPPFIGSSATVQRPPVPKVDRRKHLSHWAQPMVVKRPPGLQGKQVFTNFWFLGCVAAFFALYWVCGSPPARRYLLAAFSLLFYWHNAGSAGVAPIVMLGGVTYLAAITGRRPVLMLAVTINVLALIFYKYTIFLSEQIFGAPLASIAQIVAPLAISFFVFEFCHYTIDVMRGHAPIKSPTEFVLFALFFPTVVAGPIKRYEQFLPELKSGAIRVEPEDVARGFAQVVLGMCKKLLIADWLTGYIETWQPTFVNLPSWHRWAIFLAIGFRILLDFSGYSDIAIGLARMMGIKVPPNFNWPYLATSVQDFWHRWHISLSTWIRDYVYIPLGGSRHGLFRKAFNGLLAFAICGLWHGAAWNFVLWGLYHGVGLTISSNYVQILGRPGEILQKALHTAFPVKWFVTQAFVFVGWLYFFYPIRTANEMIFLLMEWKP